VASRHSSRPPPTVRTQRQTLHITTVRFQRCPFLAVRVPEPNRTVGAGGCSRAGRTQDRAGVRLHLLAVELPGKAEVAARPTAVPGAPVAGSGAARIDEATSTVARAGTPQVGQLAGPQA
jgi:hypothetical protein